MLNIGSSFWAILSSVFRAGGALLTLPIALVVIPESEMGLYYSFISLAGFAMLLDLGFGQTIVRFSSHAWAGVENFYQSGMPPRPVDKKPNTLLLNSLITAARFWYVLMGLVVTLILIIPGTIFVSLQITDGGLSDNLIYCWFAMSLAVGLAFASEFWRSILFGIGGLTEAHQVSIVAQLVSAIITAVALISGLGLWSFPIGRFALALVNRVWAKFFLKKRVRLTLGSWRKSTTMILLMWPMAWRQGVISIGEFLVLRAGVIICASLFGLELTARYGLTIQVIGVVTAICSAPLYVSLPTISEYRIQRNSKNIVKTFILRTYLGAFFILLFGLILAYIGPELLIAIGSKTSLLDVNLFIALLIIQLLHFHQGSWIALVLTENENPFVIPAVISGLLVVTVSFYLGSNYGIKGMILGQAIVPLLYLNWWSVMRGYKGLEISYQDFIKSIKGIR